MMDGLFSSCSKRAYATAALWWESVVPEDDPETHDTGDDSDVPEETE
jgi:hypothetical protein